MHYIDISIGIYLFCGKVDCRNRRGKSSKGRKVTGFHFINNGEDLLVTTNDSRLRLIHMDDFSFLQFSMYPGLNFLFDDIELFCFIF